MKSDIEEKHTGQMKRRKYRHEHSDRAKDKEFMSICCLRIFTLKAKTSHNSTCSVGDVLFSEL